MHRRPAAFALAGVGLLLALAVLAPPAMADHAYSHRYLLWGRVVDANGDPVPSLTLDFSSDGFFTPQGACRGATGSDLDTDAYGPTVYDPTTDAYGDFAFCFHTHKINRIEPGSGLIRINDIPEFEPVTVHFDPYFRQDFVLIQLPTVRDDADASFVEKSYTVLGRLWREASGRDQVVDDIRVYGDTLHQEPVLVELVDPQGNVVANATTRTNDYGDFAVRVPTETRFAEGTVRIQAAGRELVEPASPAGVTAFKAEFDPLPSETLKTALWVGFWIVLAGGIVGGGYYGIRKMSERREIEQARASSSRKRAKR